MKNSILFFISTFLINASLVSQVFPEENWSYSQTSESNGWDSLRVEEFERYIIDSTKVTGLLIIQDGEIVFEYGDIIENSYIASCRKSVLAMLYGKYVESGQINLNKNIEALGIDDVEGILPIEKKATIHDLISARSGVYHPEGYPGGWQEFAPERGSVEPGTYWLYNNWDFNVAGYIFEQETGENIYDEVEKQLVIPTQMQDWDRSLQKKEGDTTISKYLAYIMWFSTRDMARIGLLMLNRGKWNDQQIISENWVNEMLKHWTTSSEINENVPVFRDISGSFGYGYMWWLFEEMNDERFKNAYTAAGDMGQAIAIFPEINVVVAYKTKAAYKRSNSIKVMVDLLIKSVEIYEPE
jgi:CubicO group peptidase (beta-lactamase class C family)